MGNTTITDDEIREDFENEVEAWVHRAMPRMASVHDSKRLYRLLQRMALHNKSDLHKKSGVCTKSLAGE